MVWGLYEMKLPQRMENQTEKAGTEVNSGFKGVYRGISRNLKAGRHLLRLEHAATGKGASWHTQG